MANQRQSLTRLPSVTEETSSGLQHPVESDRMDGKEPPQHAGQLDAPQAGSSMSSESNRQQSENRTGVDPRLSSAPQAGMSSIECKSEHHDPPQTGQSLVDKSGSQQNRIDAEQQYGLNPPKAPQHGNSLLDKDNQIDQPGSCGQSRGPQTGNSLQDQQCNENENAQLNKTGPIKGPQSGESIEQVSDRQNIDQIQIKQFIVSQEDSYDEVLVSLQGLMNSCGGVGVTINPNQITFEGTGDFILKASLLLCKNHLPNKKLYVSDVAVDLLKKNLERVCLKENICVSWADGVATIYALDKDVLDRAERLINDELSEIPIPAEQFQVEFIKNKLKDTFDEISEIFDQNGGHVVNDGKSINAAVFGKCKEITSAEKKLRDLVKSVQREQRTIDHPGIQKYFESQGGQYALLGIEAKHTVVVKCREQPGSLQPGSGMLSSLNCNCNCNVKNFSCSQNSHEGASSNVFRLFGDTNMFSV